MERIETPNKENLTTVFNQGKSSMHVDETNKAFFRDGKKWYCLSQDEMEKFVSQMKTSKEIQTEPNHAVLVKE